MPAKRRRMFSKSVIAEVKKFFPRATELHEAMRRGDREGAAEHLKLVMTEDGQIGEFCAALEEMLHLQPAY